MNRIERMAAILLLLQEKACTSQEIARHFEVSRRTVLRDVQALCEMGIPVIAQEGPGGGYSLPQEYHVEPLPLTSREAFLLLLALTAIERLSDLPFRQERASLLAKLRAILPPAELSGAARWLDKVALEVPERAQRAPFLEALVEAAQHQRWVRVVYQSLERISTQHLLPRQIYSQDGFWYCRAFANERRQERIYRVDRIQSLDPAAGDFEPGPLEAALPYGHASHPQVVARLSPRGVAQMESDRHLGDQIRRLPDGGGELVFRCPPDELDWFARYFANLGLEAEVLAPPELIERLGNLGQNLVARYGKW